MTSPDLIMNSGTDDKIKAMVKIVSIGMMMTDIMMMGMGIKRMRLMIMIYDDHIQVVCTGSDEYYDENYDEDGVHDDANDDQDYRMILK